MGQYFKAVVKNKKGMKVFQPQWLKFVEHAYNEDSISNAVTYELLREPSRVAWLGNYSNDTEIMKNRLELYKTVWKQGNKADIPEGYESIRKHKYVINHDKKEYFDIESYTERSKPYEDETFTFYSIAVLTVVGNGLGCGDYCSNSWATTAELVGAWAFDLIQVADEKPEGYKEIFPTFA